MTAAPGKEHFRVRIKREGGVRDFPDGVFGIRMSGLFAKLAWVFIHLQFLVLPSSRISTGLQCFRAVLTGQRLARLIVEPEPQPTTESPRQ